MNLRFVLIGLLLFLFSTQVYALSDTNLVAWWNFDETSGTTLIDLKGYDQNGVNTNATINQTGRVSKAYSFTTSDYVTISNSVLNPTGAISISTWIYPTSNGTNSTSKGIISKAGASGNVVQYEIDQGSYLTSNGKPFFYLGSSGGDVAITSSTATTLNAWNHIVATWDGTANVNGMKLYLNEVLVAQGTYNAGTQDTTVESTFFGRNMSTANSGFIGRMDETSIWNKVLTQREITELYNSGTGITYPFPSPIDLIASYDYNFNTSTQVAYLNNTSIDVNVTQTNWEWLQNGVLLSNLENTSFTATQNTDYNVCLTVTGNEDGNALNILTDSVCQTITPWDTIAPTITANIEYGEGFITNYDINYSLTCQDNSSLVTYQVIKNDTNYLYNSVDAEGTLVERTLTLTPPDHAQLTMICRDNYGNEATQSFDTIYALTFRLINEDNGNTLTWADLNTNLKIARVYTPDGNFSYDFNSAGTSTINFFSPNNKLYFEFGYKDTLETKINRQIDFSIIPDNNIGICVPYFQTFYQQRFVANTAREMILQNNVSGCYVAASTLDYVYDTGYALTTYTIPKPYYLYIWVNGVKTFLALIDGSVATQYNLDAIAFSRTEFDITVGEDIVAFQPLINTVTGLYDTNTIIIYYKSYAQDNAQTSLTIKNDSNTIWDYIETDSPNELQVNFYWGGLGLTNEDVLELIITTIDSSGESITKSYYFTTQGTYYPNEGANSWVVIVAILFFLFGITLVAATRAFGIFGIIICIVSIAITAMASGAWWISLTQGVFLLCLIYIFMMGKTQAGELG